MERYTNPDCKPEMEELMKDCPRSRSGAECWLRLCDIEDILGEEYDLDRLRVIMDAEQHGGLIVGYGPGDPGEPGEPGVMEEVAADNVVVVRCRECAHYKICDEWENGKRMLC